MKENTGFNRRIIIGVVVLIVVFIISMVVSFMNLERSKSISARNVEVLQPSIIALNEFELLVINTSNYSDSWVFFDISDHEDKVELRYLHDKVADSLAQELIDISKHWNHKENEALLDKVMSRWDTLMTEQEWIMENLNSIDIYEDFVLHAEAEGQHLALMKEVTARTRNDLQTLIALFKSESAEEEMTAQESFSSIRTAQFILGILAILISAFVGLSIFRSSKLEEQKRQVTEERDEIAVQKAIIEEKNAEILSSISYAERLQNSILPPAGRFAESFKDHFIYFQPRDIVSGDFYWQRNIRHNGNNYVLVAAADATGHGVPGAFVSFVGYSSLNRAVDEFSLISPAKILDKASELVSRTFSISQSDDTVRDGMDIALCAFDLDNKKLTFAGAHNSAYLIRNGEVTELKACRRAVGDDYSVDPFKEQSLDLQDNDCVFIFSDGFPDQFGGPKGKKYKVKTFLRLLAEISSLPMNAQLGRLEAEMLTWRGEFEQVDDVLVMGMKV